MGLQNSKRKPIKSKLNGKNNAKVGVQVLAPEPNVSQKEHAILKQMWDIVKQDIAKVGVITFVR